MNNAMKEVRVIIPNPPIWIRIIMKTCPSKVNTWEMFTVDNPVMHTAEVEVKKASIQLIPS